MLAPYRIGDNEEIENHYRKFKLSKGPEYYKGTLFEINFLTFKETTMADGQQKNVFRSEKSPNNIIREDYYHSEIKPTKGGMNTLDTES